MAVGQTPWNKGKKGVYSQDTIAKMRKSKIEKPTRYWKGKKRDEETLRKLNEGKEKMMKEHGHPRLGFKKRSVEETRKLKALWASQRRAIKRGNGGHHTLEQWKKLKAQYDWTCPCCRRSEPQITLTVDHIVPVVKGGSNNIENIQPLCARCNSAKQTKTIKYGSF